MHGRQLDELNLTGSLPSPTGVGLTILRITQSEDYSMGDITRAIQSDPALTGRILKLANSSGRSGLEPATVVSEAAMRLGVRTVRNVALGFTLVNGNRSGACSEFDYDDYWSSSLALAVSCDALATEQRSAVPAEAFTCGLLAGIGRLALASIHPERYADLLVRSRGFPLSTLRTLEREEFNLDHTELTGAMLEDWKLPEAFVFAVRHYQDEDGAALAPSMTANRMTALLQGAVELSRLCTEDEGSPFRATPERVGTIAARAGIRPERMHDLIREVRQAWRDWGQILRIGTERFPLLAAEPHPHVDVHEHADLAAEDELARPRPPVEPARRGLRILAVDDDAASLRLLTTHLERDGHQVTNASNGREALRMALEQQAQMVVSDWMMPELDGIQLCRSLRSTADGQGIYILLVTGREDEDRIVEAFTAGADEYVVKPFNPRILLARVRAGQRMIELREQVEADRAERQRQLSRLAVLNRKLQSAAMTDVLTRLPNRRYALERLEQELLSARRGGHALSVMMIDIDHFKEVNDRFGHDAGDAVLRETASILRRTVRRTDVACRLGGEEFLVICTGSDLSSCARTAERVRGAVEESRLPAQMGSGITVSMGVAVLEAHHRNVDDLLKAADQRVYAAKAAGRNLVCWGEDPGQRSRTA